MLGIHAQNVCLCSMLRMTIIEQAKHCSATIEMYVRNQKEEMGNKEYFLFVPNRTAGDFNYMSFFVCASLHTRYMYTD